MEHGLSISARESAVTNYKQSGEHTPCASPTVRLESPRTTVGTQGVRSAFQRTTEPAATLADTL